MKFHIVCHLFQTTRPARGMTPFVAFLLSCMLFVLSGNAVAGQQREEADSPRVMLGKDKTTPGADAFIPLIFGSSAAAPVGSVTFEIRFSNDELVFQEVKDPGTEGTTVTGVAEKDSSDPQKTLLRVRIEKKNGALESGILGNLVFKVPQSVALGEKIRLKPEAQAQSPGPSPKPVAVVPVEGLVDVSAAPGVFSCFFYMH